MSESETSIIKFLLFVGGLIFFMIFELATPYRPPTVSKAKRWIINLSVTGFNNIVIGLIFAALIAETLDYVAKYRVGVLNLLDIPYSLKILATVIFMDFMLYVWHLLNHEMPFLWRFHRVHHCDLNMDVSTATRFHAGELIFSSVIRISLVFFIGADFTGILIFEIAVVAATQFHHSSLKLPRRLESLLWILFVPPSMHRIHHSVKIKERDTNYGVLFSFWDRILGTLLIQTDQDHIRIGVGAYPKQEKLNFHHLIVMPFTKPVK
ncbi:MAG TPA: sterol desaturase family protein [Desulfobacterales bacterium]|nr:sterol desaturase family protein [Desulfobacterales bacterium]